MQQQPVCQPAQEEPLKTAREPVRPQEPVKEQPIIEPPKEEPLNTAKEPEKPQVVQV